MPNPASTLSPTLCRRIPNYPTPLLYLLETGLHPGGDCAKVVLALHDVTEEPLLALQVRVVELLVELLHHADPLQHVHRAEHRLIASRPRERKEGWSMLSCIILQSSEKRCNTYYIQYNVEIGTKRATGDSEIKS